jgi:hypothetical protein
LLRERNQMRERDQGARMGEGTGARGAPSQAGLGRTAGQNPVARTTTDRKSVLEAKSETELSNARD